MRKPWHYHTISTPYQYVSHSREGHSIEKKVRSALHRSGFRFRVCDRRYPGSPDYRIPKSNVEFWQKKFTRNKQRDEENLAKYQDMCWRVCTVWECAIRGKNSKQKIEKVTDQIIEWLDESTEAELVIKG